MERTSEATAVTILRPSGPWVGLDLAELWRFRDLLLVLAERDLRLRYRQTALGVLWVVFQPLLGAAVLAFVFGRVAGLTAPGVPYLPFAFAGLLAWTLFSTILLRSTTALVSYPQLVSKVYFPRQLLPLSTVLPALVDFAVGAVLLVAMLLALRIRPGAGIFLCLLWLVPLVALAIGLGLLASSLAATYRDVAHVAPVLVQLLMYASPVAYSTAAVPPRYRPAFLLNPLAPILERFRSAALGLSAGFPDGRSPLLTACLVSFVILLAGLVIFARRQRRLADVI
jgi:lipopolysaccharide transport system permease protein